MNRGPRKPTASTLSTLLLALALTLGQLLLLAHSHEDGTLHAQVDCQLCLHQAGSKAGGTPAALTPATPPYFAEPASQPITITWASPRQPAQARAPPSLSS
ncbi:hypothetical protein [Alkalilimnicola sp. S0819]|uniref:hypothetical protein n=1 Tax=Alkalilimnicola sp. S0819 TaxID=2613922 RepID=UPI0012624781|nr:hypothetical protein [Alkalilimnicola sp. S0819]KAB7627220.1 hypothetical protein F3N43_04730 [Alkalilimnicola sp. S0819]MPQ15933.1 hypothetical protein [Alkalilimnicola sp. S0819]